MKHTHFTKRKFLEGIGKNLLQELFTAADSNGSALTSTLSPDLPDKDFFDAVARLAMNPEQLPDSIQKGKRCTGVPLNDTANSDGIV